MLYFCYDFWLSLWPHIVIQWYNQCMTHVISSQLREQDSWQLDVVIKCEGHATVKSPTAQ